MLSSTKNEIAPLDCILLYWHSFFFFFLNCNFKYSGNSTNITGSQVLLIKALQGAVSLAFPKRCNFIIKDFWSFICTFFC